MLLHVGGSVGEATETKRGVDQDKEDREQKREKNDENGLEDRNEEVGDQDDSSEGYQWMVGTHLFDICISRNGENECSDNSHDGDKTDENVLWTDECVKKEKGDDGDEVVGLEV